MGQIYDKFPTSAVEFRKFASLAERDRARAGYARDLPELVSGSGEKTVADLNLCKDWGGLFRRLRPHLFLALSLKERAKEDREAKMIGETNSGSLKRAPAAGLQANRPGFFTLAAVRFFFRHFHIAETGRPQACRKIQEHKIAQSRK